MGDRMKGVTRDGGSSISGFAENFKGEEEVSRLRDERELEIKEGDAGTTDLASEVNVRVRGVEN